MLMYLPQCLNVRPVEVRAFLVMAHGCKCQVRHVADESVCRPVSHMDHIHMHTHRQTLTHANTMTRSNTHILTHTNAQRQIPYTHIHTGMHIQCNMQTHTHTDTRNETHTQIHTGKHRHRFPYKHMHTNTHTTTHTHRYAYADAHTCMWNRVSCDFMLMRTNVDLLNRFWLSDFLRATQNEMYADAFWMGAFLRLFRSTQWRDRERVLQIVCVCVQHISKPWSLSADTSLLSSHLGPYEQPHSEGPPLQVLPQTPLSATGPSQRWEYKQRRQRASCRLIGQNDEITATGMFLSPTGCVQSPVIVWCDLYTLGGSAGLHLDPLVCRSWNPSAGT